MCKIIMERNCNCNAENFLNLKKQKSIKSFQMTHKQSSSKMIGIATPKKKNFNSNEKKKSIKSFRMTRKIIIK